MNGLLTWTETVSPSLEPRALAALPIWSASSRLGATTTPYGAFSARLLEVHNILEQAVKCYLICKQILAKKSQISSNMLPSSVDKYQTVSVHFLSTPRTHISHAITSKNLIITDDITVVHILIRKQYNANLKCKFPSQIIVP
jgi:hypothetical protein